MRTRLIVTAFIVMLTLWTACGRSSGPILTPAGASAEVTPDKATFTIPVEQRSIWRWHVESTPFNAFEYSWEVSQEGMPSFGFSVWKKGDAPPKEGNLSQLIEAGQGSIWERTPDGGRMVGKVEVTAIRQDSAMEIILVEQPFLKQFLEKRPPTVEVVIKTLDAAKPHFSIAEQRYSLPVKYRDR
jgi:hypothetical protein